MREDIAGPQGASSRPMWETLEGMVREKAQEFIQQIMEEEVTELLGREKSERRSTVDSAEGYRNMREDIAGPQGASSRPMWETLDGMVREKAQEFIQQIMKSRSC